MADTRRPAPSDPDRSPVLGSILGVAASVLTFITLLRSDPPLREDDRRPRRRPEGDRGRRLRRHGLDHRLDLAGPRLRPDARPGAAVGGRSGGGGAGARDPITLLESRLAAAEAVWASAHEDIDDAGVFAESSPDPDPADILVGIYTEVSS